jgi:threonine dehydrogenase-like Zn-dependent dehydrogenase
VAGVETGVIAVPALTTMKAAVVSGPQQVEIEHIAVPEPQTGEVRIRLEGSGVCGSNLPLWEGRPWFHYPVPPGSPGHEGWGTIDAVGDGVGSVRIGDRVAALSSRAYAEYDVTDQDSVIRLPDALRGRPFPGEPLGCAMNVFRRSEIQPGDTVAIVGIGFLGAVLTRLAFRRGARVIAISRRRFALDLARELGAEIALDFENPSRIIDDVKRISGRDGADRVIEVTGLQGPLDLAGELTRVRGRLVIAGYHQDGMRQINLQLWNWRGLDVINAHERDPATYLQGIREAVDAVSSGVLDPTPLYTHSFPLDQLHFAFDAMRTRPDGFLKALVLA